MRSLLLICADTVRSAAVINALAAEHDIWHVARHRDGMAWLKNHHPETIALDLDLLGQDASALINLVRANESNINTIIIGWSKNPDKLSPALLKTIDQMIR